MNFAFSEEQEQLREFVRSFLADKSAESGLASSPSDLDFDLILRPLGFGLSCLPTLASIESAVPPLDWVWRTD